MKTAHAGNSGGTGQRGHRYRKFGGPVVLAPAEAADGRKLCPVCRNAASLTPVGGVLRAHRDLFGYNCYNRAVGAS